VIVLLQLQGADFTSTIHHDTYPAIDPANQLEFSRKHVFITGASKGVGRAIAISFAKAGAAGIAIGARSDLSDLESDMLSAAKTAGKPSPRILKIKLDVMDHASVENAAREVQETFGNLDILINNAGYLSSFKSVAETDPTEWWTNWEVNIRGVYWVTKEFLPLLLKGEGKTIINVSSIGAHTLSLGASGYQSTKFALLRFTEFICADYATQGILAYCIHPGAVSTELGRKMPSQVWSYLNDTPELAGDTLVSLTAKKRNWLAGRYISVNWDMPELYRREEEIIREDKLKMRMRF